LNKHVCTTAAALIRGLRLLTFRPHVWRLIEGGAYSSKYGSQNAAILINLSQKATYCTGGYF